MFVVEALFLYYKNDFGFKCKLKTLLFFLPTALNCINNKAFKKTLVFKLSIKRGICERNGEENTTGEGTRDYSFVGKSNVLFKKKNGYFYF